MSSYSSLVLAAVGGVEAIWGAYLACFPKQATADVVGRVLAVGAAASSPALLPLISQTGVLRLGLGVFMVAVATLSTSVALTLNLAACAAAHTCVLQPFAAVMRSHERLPVTRWLAVSFLEGAALVLGMAVDADFDRSVLLAEPAFSVASGCLLVCLLLILCQTCKSSGLAGSSHLVSPASGLTVPVEGGLLFDESRHQLSPASKRLLS